jgi:hypothetical protein
LSVICSVIQQLINNYTLMKKATRLLILTAFVLPLLMVTRAYAGGPGPGQRTNFGERERLGLDPSASQTQGTDPFNTDVRTTDGFRPTQPDANPLNLQNPIFRPGLEFDRKDLWDHDFQSGRDPFAGYGNHPSWDPGTNSGSGSTGAGGGTAPIDGGISLLLAAGLGLGLKRARARKQTV